MEAMLEGDFSLKPTDEYYLYGAENLKNEIKIVMVHYILPIYYLIITLYIT